MMVNQKCRLGVLALRFESRDEGVDESRSDDEENPTVDEKVAHASQASMSSRSPLTF